MGEVIRFDGTAKARAGAMLVTDGYSMAAWRLRLLRLILVRVSGNTARVRRSDMKYYYHWQPPSS